MPTLTNAEAYEAQRALGILAGRELPIDAALDIPPMVREVSTHVGDVETLRMDAIRRFAIKDEDGKVKTDKQGRAQFAKDEDEEAYRVFCDELMAKEHEFKHMLKASTLKGAKGLKPQLVLALGALYVDDRKEAE